MSKTTIEDKQVLMRAITARLEDPLVGSKVIVFDDYASLRDELGLGHWSNTRIKRTIGSLHHSDRLLRAGRVGELTMSSEHRPGCITLRQ